MKVKTTPLWSHIGFKAHNKHITCLRGGRGSGKTHTYIQKKLIEFANEKDCNYLFSVKEDVNVNSALHPRCLQVIEENGLQDRLRITSNPARIYNEHGKIIFLRGFDKPMKAKQLASIGVSFMDEADHFTYEDYKVILGTTREIEEYELTLAFNPVSETSWIKQELYDNEKNRVKIVDIHSTCEDNPFLPESKKQEYRDLEGIDRQVDYLGEWGTITSELVFGSRINIVESIPDHATYLSTGLDFTGFANDPNAMVEVYYADGELHLKELLYDVREIVSFNGGNDVLTVIRNECSHIGTANERGEIHHIIGDSADLLSINLLRQHGIHIVGAKKGPGSILAGIKKLNLYKKINILSSSTNAIFEFRNYKWKKINGKITPVPLNNQQDHIIDAVRYALEIVSL